MRELRFALRVLGRDRRFAAVVVMTLAIGVGVNTTVFTLLNAVALRPLPAPDADRVVRIYPVDARGQRENLFSYRDYLGYREAAPSIAALAAYVPVTVSLGFDERGAVHPPDETLAYVVSSNYFDVLGMRPAAGRSFVRDDDQAGAPRAAIISERLWDRRFGREPRAIGASLEVNGRRFSVVGVVPASFIGSEPLVPEIWVPVSAHDVVAPGLDALDDRDARWLLAIGRLRPHGTRSSAAAELSVTAQRLAIAYPSERRPGAVAVVRGTYFSLDPRAWPMMALVMGVAALVLIIACANVANLTLARAVSRQRELAIRAAIGATQGRIARLLLAESVLIGVAGSATGLLLSGWVLRFLYPLGVSLVPFPAAAILLDLRPDARVFAYTGALATAAGLAIGLAPALQLALRSVSPALHEDGAVAGATFTASRLRRALVVVQVATCVVLLANAGLLTRAVVRARTLDLGFDPHQVIASTSHARRHGFTEARAASLHRAVAARAALIPGWRGTAFTSHVPLTGGLHLTTIQGNSGAAIITPVRLVSATYFDALRIPIVSGRTFTAEETAGDASVAILSETLARRFWPDIDPIGQVVRASVRSTPATIVGIVRDTSSSTLWQGKEMAIYFPVQPSTDPRDLRLLARFDGDVASAAAELRAAARQVEPSLGFDAAPLTDAVRLWMLPSRVAATAAAVLALIALVLASIGLYSVLAYDVVRRTRELGVRMALGARSADVMRLVIGDGARLLAVGIGVGLLGALLGTRALRRMLLDISTTDPLTFVIVTVALAGVGLAACYFPARRASRVEPLAALRSS